jgi:hypothetical protein
VAIATNPDEVAEKSRFLNAQTERRSFDDLVSEYLTVYRDVSTPWSTLK